jgi:WD40 repeat protein
MFQRRTVEIHTKYDTRLFDICGQYVCTTGYLTKIWDLQNGQQVMSMSHGETVKVTALAFKPGGNAENEGKRLWLGTNSGDIHEIDIQSQMVVLTKTSAHPRREVTKIYRHQNEMWTLDDDGKLNIWLPDEDGLPNLQNSQVLSFRVPKAHSFP